MIQFDSNFCLNMINIMHTEKVNIEGKPFAYSWQATFTFAQGRKGSLSLLTPLPLNVI